MVIQSPLGVGRYVLTSSRVHAPQYVRSIGHTPTERALGTRRKDGERSGRCPGGGGGKGDRDERADRKVSRRKRVWTRCGNTGKSSEPESCEKGAKGNERERQGLVERGLRCQAVVCDSLLREASFLQR